MAVDRRLYWIWMQLALQAGNPSAGSLLDTFSSPEEVYAAGRDTLEQAGVRKEDDLQRLSDKSLHDAETLFNAYARLGCWMLTPDDACYPMLLRGIYAPPLVLYGMGAPPMSADEPAIGMVGTRESSGYGDKVAARLSAGLAAGGMTVISGGARGIDAASHEAAMAAGGRTVAVQACGLDKDYPAETREMRRRILEGGGMVVTEFPPGMKAYPWNFEIRNRLISGMSLGVCVVEAPQGSGALITARHAREQGRDVFAVPGDVRSPLNAGCHQLIEEGAHLVADACRILMEYQNPYGGRFDLDAARRAQEGIPAPMRKAATAARHVSRPARRKTETPTEPALCSEGVSPDAQKVLAALDVSPRHIDLLAQETGLPAARVMAALTELEINGAAAEAGAQTYKRL